MRISDWSSDVCSSDLWLYADVWGAGAGAHALAAAAQQFGGAEQQRRGDDQQRRRRRNGGADLFADALEHLNRQRALLGASDEQCDRGLVERGHESENRPRGDARTNERHEDRSEEHTSELQSLMRISYAVFCLKKKKQNNIQQNNNIHT